MGNSKSHYSREEFLYYCIEKKNYVRMEETLDKLPELINKPLTKDIKHTAIMRAAFHGDLTAGKMFLKRGADLNMRSRKGQSALTIATNRNHLSMVEWLLECKADPNPSAQNGLRAIDYAILKGNYNIAERIFKELSTEQKSFREPEAYEELSSKYATRFVNYRMILQGLVLKVPEHELGDYLTKEKKILVDPVVDPRESWKQWVKRQLDFKDAPLIEREALPQNLQPQNRILGKIHHYTHNFMKSPISQSTLLHPNKQADCGSEMGHINKKKQDQNKETLSEWNA